jgi:hypothetical protein
MLRARTLSLYVLYQLLLYNRNQNCDISINTIRLLSMKFCRNPLKGSHVVKFWHADGQTQIWGGEQAYFYVLNFGWSKSGLRKPCPGLRSFVLLTVSVQYFWSILWLHPVVLITSPPLNNQFLCEPYLQGDSIRRALRASSVFSHWNE